MKPASISFEDIAALRPVCLRRTVPEAYLDLNNHMNMRWYVALFDDAGDTLHDHLGLTREFRRGHGSGTMDLEHHTWFINEVMAESQICIYTRMVASRRLSLIDSILSRMRWRIRSRERKLSLSSLPLSGAIKSSTLSTTERSCCAVLGPTP